MKRKIVSITITSIITLLCACEANLQSNHTNSTEVAPQELSNSHSLADGLYFAKEDNYSNDGWKHIVNVEITNGKIETITFDAVNENATTYKRNLSINDELDSELKDTSILKWHEQLELIENYLLTSQTDSHLLKQEDFPTISGVTLDFLPFAQLFNQAIKNGPLVLGSYQDGHYYAESEEIEKQLKHTIHLIIENGYIIAAHWDTLPNNDQNSDNITTDYLLSQQGVEQANLLEDYLIEIQDPMQMTFNEENKSTDITGVTIEVHQFIELAVKALASGPLIN